MKWIIFFWFCGTMTALAQQETQFTQYVFNTMHVNPAYAGYKGETYFQSFYRSQWVGMEGAPKTLSFSLDGAPNDRIGLSFIVNNDRIGVQSHLSAYAGYAYHLPAGHDDAKLSFGLSLGAIQSKLDGDLLSAETVGDQYIPGTSVSSILPDARFGVLYSNSKFYIGLAANNMIASWIGKSKSDASRPIIPRPHLYLTGGAIFDLNTDLKIKPGFLIKDDVQGPTNMDINAFLLVSEKIWVGAMYRTAVKLYDKPHLQNDLRMSSSTGLMTEFMISRQFRIGYSYDYALNKLTDYNSGTHEVSVGLFVGKRAANITGCYF